MNNPVLQPEDRVLSTLDADGKRRWLFPKLATGELWHARRLVAYALIAVYTLLPFIRINGRPAVQFDLIGGKFSFFGLVLLPNELHLVALFFLIVGLSIFCATAIIGRVWCGWGCPQTVYLEFVFRPIERLFTGTAGKGGNVRRPVAGWRKGAMYGFYLLICLHLANTFLAYFVGVDNLHKWIWTSPPWEHPGAFLLVMFVTGLMMFDFCYWREQLCIIGCPYGRFQSVMLDKDSLIVGYDAKRGEPRGHGRDREEKGLGSCVACNLCVDVCPTGIDIREGLQMECVNCTQCIDACNVVMDKTNQPRGLIRYSSQAGLDGNKKALLRPRLFVYGGLILLLLALFIGLVLSRTPFNVTLMRGLGSPFLVREEGDVENLVRVKLVNRTDEKQTVTVQAIHPQTVTIARDNQFVLEPRQVITEPIYVRAPADSFYRANGVVEATFRITGAGDASYEKKYKLFGLSAPRSKKEDSSTPTVNEIPGSDRSYQELRNESD
jgi:cytochrome c oxidase accessory protein FixG